MVVAVVAETGSTIFIKVLGNGQFARQKGRLTSSKRWGCCFAYAAKTHIQCWVCKKQPLITCLIDLILNCTSFPSGWLLWCGRLLKEGHCHQGGSCISSGRLFLDVELFVSQESMIKIVTCFTSLI